MRLRAVIIALLFSCGLAHASRYTQYIQAQSPGPDILWQENETSGTTLDNSGSGGADYDLTTHNTPTLNQPGFGPKHGKAIFWDSASSEYADKNQNDTGSGPGDLGSDLTVSCWKKTSDTAGGAIVSTNDDGMADDLSRIWALAASGGATPTFVIYNSDFGTTYLVANGGTTLDNNTWYYIAGTYDVSEDDAFAYLNGVEDATDTTTNGTKAGAVQYWEMHRNLQTSTAYDKGTSQDCAVWGGTKWSEADILQQYLHGISAGGWPFQTKLTEPPDYHRDDYWKTVARHGYLTGWLESIVMAPFSFQPWLPLSFLPPGAPQ